jgi:hypothetical protein
MRLKYGTAAGAALFAFTLFLLPAEAADGVTAREKRDCQVDYKNYCSEYGLGTNALRACMSRNIKKVSHTCVGALVAAGEMSQAQADKLRGKGKTSSKKKPAPKKKTTHTSSKKKH